MMPVSDDLPTLKDVFFVVVDRLPHPPCRPPVPFMHDAVTRYARSLGRLQQFVLLLVLGLCQGAALAQALPAWPGTVQAVRSDWNAQQPPESGWVDVTLPDDWSLRWPDFDGVVWYRLRWNQAPPLAETGLFIDYLNMAGVISINGAVLERDASLIEPLTRMWNAPRYWLLAPQLLREGENTLLVRISGLAAYQPGLGPAEVGSTVALRERYEGARWLRQRLGFASLAIGTTLGLFFLVLWLMRRSEVAYGWYGAQQLAWFPLAWNQIATSPWPFTSTDAYQAMTTAALLVFTGCYAMFVLRFCERRWPRLEAVLWIVLLMGSLWVFLAPHHAMRDVRGVLTLLTAAINTTTNLGFLWLAWRHGRTDQRILSLCAMVGLIAGVHDALVLVRLVGGNAYYASLTEHLTVIGVALVLAWNFVRNLRRIEDFNRELLHSVDEARNELAGTLTRQHELELVHARLGERIGLAHDLHDGLGGMLIGNIAALERAPEQMNSRAVLGMLQELRDDLRLIIDTASAQHYGEHSLAELLAPLRHRMTRLFEAHDMSTRWQIGNLDKVYLTTTQSLDLLRILQEALANTLKHSKARRVEVDLLCDSEALCLEVRDDGVGLASANETDFGTGVRSMHARARRLDATLTIGCGTTGTLVRLRRPWPGSLPVFS
jgi:signal transduction histidine kinase